MLSYSDATTLILSVRQHLCRLARMPVKVCGPTFLVDIPDVTASTEPSSGALSLQQAGDLLAPEPTVLTGALIGYARDYAKDQIPDRQTAALEAAGCIRIFAGKQSGGNADRKELRKALDYLRPGDTRSSRPRAGLAVRCRT